MSEEESTDVYSAEWITTVTLTRGSFAHKVSLTHRGPAEFKTNDKGMLNVYAIDGISGEATVEIGRFSEYYFVTQVMLEDQSPNDEEDDDEFSEPDPYVPGLSARENEQDVFN